MPIYERLRFKNSLAASAVVLALGTFGAPAHAAETTKTIGLVVTSWFTAMHNTPYWDECPEGAALGNDELWIKGLSQADRIKNTKAGSVQPVDGERKSQAVVRGPNGVDVCWNPESVIDPPLHTVKGKTGYGFNLDGTEDGKATPKSCAHEKFTTPDGLQKVDNQAYRVLGCILGWRNGNYMEGHPNGERQNSGKGTILIEVSGVHDMQNDDSVTVKFYGALDPMPKDSTGNILPYASYHVSKTPLYGAEARGRIVDGVLMTDPIDANLPLYGNNYTGNMVLRDMRLKITLPQDEKPVKGLLGGYYDWKSWWDYIQKVEFLLVAAQWDCPAIYRASKALADGYPDPHTGQCTALSTAMTLEALPAFIVHPDHKTDAPRVISQAQ